MNGFCFYCKYNNNKTRKNNHLLLLLSWLFSNGVFIINKKILSKKKNAKLVASNRICLNDLLPLVINLYLCNHK
jgi:hypothetical protein